MIKQLSFFISDSFLPYYNIALEDYLTRNVKEHEMILFLWQNAQTVVIGKNQNCFKECKVEHIQEDGGHVARRLSGGGAVYHDLGNLNFSFIMNKKEVDLSKQMEVIKEAVQSFGLRAEMTGRNDITIDEKKFSGNAFFKTKEGYCHHGTILIDTDVFIMGRYLNPSVAKLHSKGVESVQSRVINLQQLNSDVTVETMKKAMLTAFSKVYGRKAVLYKTSNQMEETVQLLKEKYESWEWNCGRAIPFTNSFADYFSWGEIHMEFAVNRGVIEEAVISSDAMNSEWFEGISTGLKGCKYQCALLCDAIEKALCEREVPTCVRGDLERMIHKNFQ